MRLGLRNALLIVLTFLTAVGIVLVVNGSRSIGFTPIGGVDRPAPRPASPLGIPVPPVARNIYLAPFGEFPRAKAEALVTHYEQQFGLTIEITPSIPLPAEALDTERDQ